jgi:hypothetical protein
MSTGAMVREASTVIRSAGGRQVVDLALGGGLGAIVGLYWYVELVRVDSLWVRNGLAGLCLGGCLGAFLNGVGSWRERAWLRLARGVVLGFLAGAAGGAIGLVLGEWILGGFRGGLLGRGVAWGILGLVIGSSQAVVQPSRERLFMGILGGGMGGFLGGVVFELLREAGGGARYDLSQALGIVCLGGGLGLSLGLAERALREAWLVVGNGRQEGREYLLAGQRSVIGLDEHVEIGLFGDLTVERRHAAIERAGAGHQLHVLATRQPTRVNGELVKAARTLEDGDRIELGRTVVWYRKRRRGGEPA